MFTLNVIQHFKRWSDYFWNIDVGMERYIQLQIALHEIHISSLKHANKLYTEQLRFERGTICLK